MFVQNSQQNGVSFRVAYSRKFEEFGLQTIKRGSTVKFRGGFNVFDTVNDLDRSIFGYSVMEYEVELSAEPEAEEIDGALKMSPGMAATTGAALVSLLFFTSFW